MKTFQGVAYVQRIPYTRPMLGKKKNTSDLDDLEQKLIIIIIIVKPFCRRYGSYTIRRFALAGVYRIFLIIRQVIKGDATISRADKLA